MYFRNLLYEEILLFVSQCLLHGSIIKRKFYLNEICSLGFTFSLADKEILPENVKGQMPVSDYSKFDVAPDGKTWN